MAGSINLDYRGIIAIIADMVSQGTKRGTKMGLELRYVK